MDPVVITVAVVAGILAYVCVGMIINRLTGRLRSRTLRRQLDRELKNLLDYRSIHVIPNGPVVRSRPVDPDQPPHFAIHVQAPGDPVTLCTCHQTPIADGDRVLLWPGTELLCARTYQDLSDAPEEMP